MTGNADTASLVDVTNTTGSNLTFFPTFVSATTGNTEIRTDSDNFKYVPSSNTLSVIVCSTNFEIQGNLNITGTITFGQSQVGSIANHDTDALTEGSTNLYYTDERVDDRIDALIVADFTGLTKTYDDASNTYTLAFSFSEFDTDSVVEDQQNLFTTAARTRTHFTYGTGIELSGAGQLSVTQADINTDNVTEGSTNLFTTAARTRSHFTYGTGITHDGSGGLSVTQADINTDNVTEGSTNPITLAARTRGHISVGGDLSYNSGTGVISFTERTDAEVNTLADARIAAADTDDLSEGCQYFTTARARQSISATQNITYNSSTGVITGPSLATVAGTGAYSDLSGTPSLATVATSGAYSDLGGLPSLFSGNYNDLSNKPTLVLLLQLHHLIVLLHKVLRQTLRYRQKRLMLQLSRQPLQTQHHLLHLK